MRQRTLSGPAEYARPNPGRSLVLSAPTEEFPTHRTATWWELAGGDRIDPFRRNLQRAYVERMEWLMAHEEARRTDIAPQARGQLVALRNQIRGAVGRTEDSASRLHLEDMAARIDAILEP